MFQSIIKEYCNHENLGLYCGHEIDAFGKDISQWHIIVTVYDAQGDPLKRKFINFDDITVWINDSNNEIVYKNREVWNEFIGG
jgi:hypothetical protein